MILKLYIFLRHIGIFIFQKLCNFDLKINTLFLKNNIKLYLSGFQKKLDLCF